MNSNIDNIFSKENLVEILKPSLIGFAKRYIVNEAKKANPKISNSQINEVLKKALKGNQEAMKSAVVSVESLAAGLSEMEPAYRSGYNTSRC